MYTLCISTHDCVAYVIVLIPLLQPFDRSYTDLPGPMVSQVFFQLSYVVYFCCVLYCYCCVLFYVYCRCGL